MPSNTMSELPNELRLRRLPLRALIAYAARCAERILPHSAVHGERRLNSLGRPATPVGSAPSADNSRSATDAVLLALQFASGKEVDLTAVEAAEQAVLREMMSLLQTTSDADRKAALVANSAYAAINAVTLVMNSAAINTTAAMADAAAMNAVGQNVVLAAFTAADAATTADERVVSAAASDYEILDLMCTGAFPQLGRGVDVSAKGPLGPLFKQPTVSKPETWRDKSPSLQQLGKIESQLADVREALLQERAGRKRDADIASRDLKQARTRIDELETEAKAFAEREQNWHQQLDEQQLQHKNATDEIAELKAQLAATAADRNSVDEREAAFKAEREEWNREREAWKQERAAWEQTRLAWSQTTEDHQAQLSRLHNAAVELTALIADAKTVADPSSAELLVEMCE